LIYNFALKERMYAWDIDNEYVSYNKQQNDLPKLKQEYPEYKWVYSKVLQHILRILEANYKSYYKLKKKDPTAKPPRFKGKKHFVTMIYNQSGFKFVNGYIQLSHKYNTTPLMFEIPKMFNFEKITQVAIFERDNNFYLSVVYEKPVKPHVDNNIYQAFDLGATKQTAVNTKGKFIEITNIRPDKYWEKRLLQLQSRRDHCKKYSRRWHKLNKLFIKCKRKCSNQLKDWQHKTSRKIVDNTKANTIIVGDLEVKKLSKSSGKYKKSLNKSMSNTGNISRLVEFVTYKAELIGKRVIQINERGTTRTCCCCGKQHIMPLSKRIMKCDCGNVIDRDKNSSINIMLRYLSKNAKWTGYQQFVDNLRHTGVPVGTYSQETPSERVV